MDEQNRVPEPQLTPDQQAVGLVLLWQLRDALDSRFGRQRLGGRVRYLHLQLYGLLGEVSDDTLVAAREVYKRGYA